MKFLKYFFFLILALTILFIAVGLLKPTVNYGHEVLVNKPIKESWGVHQDDTTFPLWLKGFKSIEHLSGEKNAVGSKYKIVINPGEGQPDFTMVETIKSIKEFDHFTLHMDSDMMDFEQTTYFSEENGKTRIRTESKAKGKGLLMRSMFALMDIFTDSFVKQEAENIENLKKVIEENTKRYYPDVLGDNILLK